MKYDEKQALKKLYNIVNSIYFYVKLVLIYQKTFVRLIMSGNYKIIINVVEDVSDELLYLSQRLYDCKNQNETCIESEIQILKKCLSQLESFNRKSMSLDKVEM